LRLRKGRSQRLDQRVQGLGRDGETRRAFCFSALLDGHRHRLYRRGLNERRPRLP
jgi:hypothetical protein